MTETITAMGSLTGITIPPIPGIPPGRKLYTIRHATDKGKGMFATTLIPRGTLILTETPIFRVPHGDYTPAIVHAEFDKLTNDAKQDFMALHSVHNLVMPHPTEKHPHLTGKAKAAAEGAWAARCGREKTVYSIFLGNSMASNEGAAVFRECSRINHSCVPNCTFIWRMAEGREHIRAVKDIKAGEELTICYCDPLLDPFMRANILRRHYGFECECKACANAENPKSFAAKSRDRRWRLRELDDKVFYMENSIAIEFNDKIELAVLMGEEGLCVPKVGESYLRISDICHKRGDLPKAIKAAALALDAYTACLGPDSSSATVTSQWYDRLQMKKLGIAMQDDTQGKALDEQVQKLTVPGAPA